MRHTIAAMNDPKKIINDYMRATGLKAYQLAGFAGITPQSLYFYLQGKRDIMMSTWAKLQRYMEQNPPTRKAG